MKASASREALEQAARDAGCTVDVKASYILISKGESGNRLFVHKTKNVSAIDVGGFDIPGDFVARNLGGDSHGSVHQQFRTDMSDAQFLINFREVCRNLDKFAPHPKKERERPFASKNTKRKDVDTVVVVSAEETPQQTIDRLVAKITLIRKVAAEHGVPVSKKTEKEIADQLEQLRKKVEVRQ